MLRERMQRGRVRALVQLEERMTHDCDLVAGCVFGEAENELLITLQEIAQSGDMGWQSLWTSLQDQLRKDET